MSYRRSHVASARRGRTAILFVIVFVVLAAGGTGAYLLTRDRGSADGAADTSTFTPAPPGKPLTAELRVAALMGQLGCTGSVIGTQQYSKEAGRCTLGDAEVTFATFASDQLRDQWVSNGGNGVVGSGWAASVSDPETADVVASKLGGRRV